MARTAIPSKVESRIKTKLKHFQPILTAARDRDINESDTCLIVTDMLAELFGYEKFNEITTEHAIRGTYCDLAITIDDKVPLLIEVKAVGLNLKDAHIRQAINYAANKGTEWVVLTNGIDWSVFKLTFAKPIDPELVIEFDLSILDPKSSEDIECLYLLTREGLLKNALPDHYAQKQATSRFALGAIILSEPVLKIINRELKRLSPGIKVSPSEIESVMKKEVLKREVVEGEKAEEAQKKVQKSLSKQAKPRNTSPKKEKAECFFCEEEKVLEEWHFTDETPSGGAVPRRANLCRDCIALVNEDQWKRNELIDKLQGRRPFSSVENENEGEV